MDRRRAIVTGITTAAVVAVAAVAIPAVAEERPTRRSAPAADAGPAPDVVAAMSRDLDLTEEQVRERLRTERWAGRTVGQLSAELGADYGGSWLAADGATLNVAVTDPAEAARVRAAGAEPKTVARSAGQLDTVKASLDRNATRASPDVAGWYVDVADNQVVVLAQPGSEESVGRFVADSGLDADQVEVLASTETPRPLFDVIGGEAYTINGNARCSVGFSVIGGFVTAGHCGAEGARTAGANQVDQGVFAASSFPGDDWAVVAVNDEWVPQGVVRDFNGGTFPVAGSQVAPVGSSVCRSGSTTGTRCGVIQALNTTVNYPEGTVTGLTRTNVCAEPGDSGGSFISGDQAQGVTSGGSGNCTVGGTTFFQPVNEILEVNGLTLVTADGAPPAAEAPPTQTPPATEPPAAPPPAAEPPAEGECAGNQVERSGTLRSGRGQIQPGRFFRSTAGLHTACLDGPDGADFDLYLQRWTGGGWRTVARATGSGADEQLTHQGRAGVYRYRVQSDSGSGQYVLGFSVR
nr:S1 family peptidase [Micromonospora sp. DSM 115978]